MDEYIEREAAIRVVNGQSSLTMTRSSLIDSISNLPAADVAPVVHAHWDDSGRYTFPGGSTAVRCTNCGCALTVSEYHLNNWNYCPVCGARMNGSDNDG